MPDSCTYVYIHYVWATWDRMPLVTPLVETEIYACLSAKCRELKCIPLAIGGTEDHVHVLARLHPMVAIAQLAHGMKGSSSHLITHRLAYLPPFRWQGCYGAFSVRPKHVRRIANYIENQKDHHVTKKLWPLAEKCEAFPDDIEIF